MNDREWASTVATFLKQEGFYVIVVIVAVVTFTYVASLQLSGKTESRPTRSPFVDQIQLLTSYDKALKQPGAIPLAVRRLPQAVEAIKLLLFAAGTGAILLLAFRKIARRRLLPAGPFQRPVLTLWDCFKVASFWFAGRQVLRMIFPSDPVLLKGTAAEWLAEIFGYVLLVGLLVHVVCLERSGRLAEIGLGRRNIFRGILYGFIAFVALQPVLRMMEAAKFHVLWKTNTAMPLGEVLTAMLKTNSRWAISLSVFVAVIMAPLVEELFFRGTLQPALKKWLGPRAGILTAAAFFAAMHPDPLTMPCLFVLGVVLGYVYDRTGSIAAPAVLHMAFNGLNVLQLFAFRSLNLG